MLGHLFRRLLLATVLLALASLTLSSAPVKDHDRDLRALSSAQDVAALSPAAKHPEDIEPGPFELAARALALVTRAGRASFNGTRGTGTVGNHSCPGNLVESPIRVFNDKAMIYLYYSGNDNGTNCAFVDNKVGDYMPMLVLLAPPNATSFAFDAGDYSEFAGSVRVTQMSEQCVRLYVNVNGEAWQSPEDFHCG